MQETIARLFAVGDIHGCVAELDVLLAGLPAGEDDELVFLGDYLDRGPASAEVVDRLCSLAATARRPPIFLRGNHEDMCLAFLGRGGRHGDAFLANGGMQTAQSYGVAGPVTPSSLDSAIPARHLAFLEATRRHHAHGSFLCVHAGIRPGVALADQQERDLFWIRSDFIAAPHGLGCTVVFGHTPVHEVIVDLPYKIGIDTGCVYGGYLTAIELPSGRLFQVRRGSGEVVTSMLPRGDT